MGEFGRTIKQNGGNGTEHGYGTAIFMAGGLLKKSQVHTDWPGLKKKEMYDGRDLNATIDARSAIVITHSQSRHSLASIRPFLVSNLQSVIPSRIESSSFLCSDRLHAFSTAIFPLGVAGR